MSKKLSKLILVTTISIQAILPGGIGYANDNIEGKNITQTKIENEDMPNNIKNMTEDNKKEIVNIPDPQFRALLNRNIHKIIGDQHDNDIITKSQLENLTRIDESRVRGIKSIEGIQHCINMNTIYIDNQEISDISPLKELKKLVLVSLRYNKITDITSLGELSNLAVLHLGKNEISDISTLGNLTELGIITIEENKINDISPLKNLKMLHGVELENQNIIGNEVSTTSNTAKVFNIVEDLDGEFVAPTVSNDYEYRDGRIIFSNITTTGYRSYNFNKKINIGTTSAIYSGKVTHNILKL